MCPDLSRYQAVGKEKGEARENQRRIHTGVQVAGGDGRHWHTHTC